MKLLLREYLGSGDISEACRCLQELDVPHFHHELVYEVCVVCMCVGVCMRVQSVCVLAHVGVHACTRCVFVYVCVSTRVHLCAYIHKFL